MDCDCELGVQVKDTGGQSGPWLQNCVVSLSPCLDLLVVAHGQKAAILSGQTYNMGCGHHS